MTRTARAAWVVVVLLLATSALGCDEERERRRVAERDRGDLTGGDRLSQEGKDAVETLAVQSENLIRAEVGNR